LFLALSYCHNIWILHIPFAHVVVDIIAALMMMMMIRTRMRITVTTTTTTLLLVITSTTVAAVVAVCKCWHVCSQRTVNVPCYW